MNHWLFQSSISSSQSSFSSQQLCTACERYGRVRDSSNQDMKPVMYCNLAATLLNPTQCKSYTHYSSNDKQLLWHSHLLGRHYELIVQIIKNLITYAEHYMVEEFADDIELLLSRHDFHVSRELFFIANVIEKLQKKSDNDLNYLLKCFQDSNGDQAMLCQLLMKGIHLARLFSLLSILFLEKDEKNGLSIRAVGPPPLTSQGYSTQQSSQQSTVCRLYN